MRRTDRSIIAEIIITFILCFIAIFLILFLVSCQELLEEETLHTGIVESVNFIDKDWTGDYYMVKFEGLEQEFKITKWTGSLPIVGKRYDLLRSTATIPYNFLRMKGEKK